MENSNDDTKHCIFTQENFNNAIDKIKDWINNPMFKDEDYWVLNPGTNQYEQPGVDKEGAK